MRRAAVLLILFVAGCGGDKESPTTVTVTAGAPTQAQQTEDTTSEASVPDFTVPKATTDTEPAVTTPEPTAPSPGGTLATAEQAVSKAGYAPDNPSQYHPDQTLRVLVATRKDSGDGYAKKAFFFVGGRYIGTDTSNDSAGIRVAGQGDRVITLEYAIYRKDDALCCPSSSATVRYQWNGSRLVPLDPIPSGRG